MSQRKSRRHAHRNKPRTAKAPATSPLPRITPRQGVFLAGVLLALGAAMALACLLRTPQPSGPTAAAVPELPAPPAPSFTGAAHCGQCHQTQVDDWHGSHHDLAMQPATDSTVLGDFADRSFTADGIRSRFFRDGDAFRVHTDGPDGTLHTYTVSHTFGVEPLQQYLVEFPDGRRQVLGIAWDSRSRENGGQRWFKLYADRNVDHQHPLHWSKRSQNWNFMCAECHSTHLEKRYQPDTDRYDTTWSDIDVSCEACHGPASNHLLWTDPTQRERYRFGDHFGLTHRFTERQGIHWQRRPGQPPVRSEPRSTETEIQVCAACHSRRAQVFEDDRTGQPLMDSHLPATLDAGLYHPDGQVLDEVFVYGSFVQSRMYDAGVTCSDCHNPHSLKLKAEGDGVCLQCHEPQYASRQHHHHEPDTEASACVACHMPASTFMVVDARRDHSFRLPRPDLTERLGVPNSCNGCHTDKEARWASDTLKQWYGKLPQGHQTFAEILHEARHGDGSATTLSRLLTDTQQPAIARATAARLLAPHNEQPAVMHALATALNDPAPQVRQAAVDAMKGLPLNLRWQQLRPRLRDSHRVVRITAAEALAEVPPAQVAPGWQAPLMQAFGEFEAAQRYNADSPQAQVKLGNFLLAQGYQDRAEAAYQAALKLDPQWSSASVNLADLYRRQHQDEKGAALLQDALSQQPDHPDLHHAMGLLQVRLKQPDAALKHLQRAASGQPQNVQYQYVYAVALDSYGQRDAAIAWLRQTSADSPRLEGLLRQWQK